MIFAIVIISLMAGGAFGYLIAALLLARNIENDTPEPQITLEPQIILDSHSLKNHCIKLDFPKDYFCSEKEAQEVIANRVLAEFEPLIIRNLKIERNPFKMRYEATVNIWTED